MSILNNSYALHEENKTRLREGVPKPTFQVVTRKADTLNLQTS